MCTLDIDDKSQYFVEGGNHILLRFFVFSNHEYNLKMHLRCTNMDGLKL
jgi:hypothetical protein